MKQAYLILSLILLPILSFCQLHDAHWVNGTGYNGMYEVPSNLLNFNNVPITISLFTGNTGMRQSNTTLSDRKGNFLCYSNGIRVVNNKFQLIENGDSLSWGEIAQDYYFRGYPGFGAMIGLPSIQTDSAFYLIHTLMEYSNIAGLLLPKYYFSIVDMRKNSGAGKVIQKNQLLWTGVRIKQVSACQHGNGRDWWVMAQEDTVNAYHRALLGPQGFTQIDTQRIGYKATGFFNEGGGQNLFTPDGTKYIDFDAWNGIRIFDFNRCSGKLSNPLLIPFPERWSFGGGAAISPNSRFLYVCSSARILQYDLWAQDIGSSGDTVAIQKNGVPGFSEMNLMMDGRIYIMPFSWTYDGHYIRYPNRKGIACEVVQAGVHFENESNATIPHFPNYRLGADLGSPCDTLGIVHAPLAWWRYDVSDTSGLSIGFTDNSWYRPFSWHWNFGDPTSSQNESADTNAVHLFTAPGTYEVCLAVCNSYGCDTMCRTLEVKTVGTQTSHFLEGVLIYPNPASDHLTVQLPEFKLNSTFVLTDLLGRVVLSTTLMENPAELHIASLTAGVYFAQLRYEDKVQNLGKVLIMR
ncbi:MAG: PKD domain-containing protein [Saprospiraceae bacterium]|nr:PKD domain-containing protein [Saprospiraceae bacterium]